MQLKIFDKSKPVVVVCENGNTSEASAFLLLRHKIEAFVVKGGMEKAPQEIEDIASDVDNNTENEPAIDSNSSTEDSVDALKSENQALKRTIDKLTTEKTELENKYRSLYKQMEKMKTVMDTLKNSEE